MCIHIFDFLWLCVSSADGTHKRIKETIECALVLLSSNTLSVGAKGGFWAARKPPILVYALFYLNITWLSKLTCQVSLICRDVASINLLGSLCILSCRVPIVGY